MPLNPDNVPIPLRKLLPFAEEWGKGDDLERQTSLQSASREELESLIQSIDGVSDDELFGWLAGPESYNPEPSDEYVALSVLVEAINLAKVRLKQMQR